MTCLCRPVAPAAPIMPWHQEAKHSTAPGTQERGVAATELATQTRRRRRSQAVQACGRRGRRDDSHYVEKLRLTRLTMSLK